MHLRLVLSAVIFSFLIRVNNITKQHMEAIQGLDEAGKRILDALPKAMHGSSPFEATKSKFVSGLKISKDPRLCPSLFFHDSEYFTMVSLLGQKPTMVLPIVQDEVNLATIEATYGLEKSTNSFYLSTRYFLGKFTDQMMARVKGMCHELEKRIKEQGRMPTVYEYLNIHTDMHIDEETSEYKG